jgi:hypothetical protein
MLRKIFFFIFKVYYIKFIFSPELLLFDIFYSFITLFKNALKKNSSFIHESFKNLIQKYIYISIVQKWLLFLWSQSVYLQFFSHLNHSTKWTHGHNSSITTSTSLFFYIFRLVKDIRTL